MSYLSKRNDTVTLGAHDLGGVLNVLARRIGDFHPATDLDERSYHAGAFNALLVILEHDWLRDQVEFFTAFDALRDVPMGPDEGVDDGEDNHHTVD